MTTNEIEPADDGNERENKPHSPQSRVRKLFDAVRRTTTAKIVTILGIGFAVVGSSIEIRKAYLTPEERKQESELPFRKELLKMIEHEFKDVVNEKYPVERFPQVHTEEFRLFVIHSVHKEQFGPYLRREMKSPIKRTQMNFRRNLPEIVKDPNQAYKSHKDHEKEIATFLPRIPLEIDYYIREGLDLLETRGKLPIVTRHSSMRGLHKRNNPPETYDPLKSTFEKVLLIE